MRNIIRFSEWSRICPSCLSPIYYSNKYKMRYGETHNSVCGRCKYSKISASLTGKHLSNEHKQSLKRGWAHRKENGYIHPMLGRVHSEETKQKMCLAKQKYNPFLGKHHTQETRQKMSQAWKETPRDMQRVIDAARIKNIGRLHNQIHKEKISLALCGHKLSDDTKLKISSKILGMRRSDITKEKLRIAKLNQLQSQGICRSYNPVACQFISEFGNKYGYDFQHGMNGGEVMLAGYMVDGYDKSKNVVFEYDEPKHENFNRKMKDLERISRIIQKMNCQVIRYSKRYNMFYWSFPNRSEIFIKI